MNHVRRQAPCCWSDKFHARTSACNQDSAFADVATYTGSGRSAISRVTDQLTPQGFYQIIPRQFHTWQGLRLFVYE